ncbi:MAG: hypothetical protein ABEI27_03930 [Halobellus sp.]|uniref:hypothetical protein n=1 Tax=Halobellus sp. TaxID=1979212 RepID=UPI0035D3F1E3
MSVVPAENDTDTAHITGIRTAGADPDAIVHTLGADLEIVEYGHQLQAPAVPVSLTGCPTPAVSTRAVREFREFDLLVVDAGLARSTAAPTVTVGDEFGNDVTASV